MFKPHTLLLLLLFSPPVLAEEPAQSKPAQSKPDAPQKPQITRTDLGVAYLRLENAFWSRTPDDVQRVRSINEEFDAATMAFFAGNLSQTLRVIDRLSTELLAGKPQNELLMAMSLKAECDPPVVIRNTTDRAVVRLRALYDAGIAERQSLSLALVREPATAGETATPIAPPREITLEPGQEIAVELDLTDTLTKQPPGTYQVVVLSSEGTQLPLARWPVVERSLDETRAENAARLAKIETSAPALQAALAACSDRNALLNDRPSADQSSQFLADPHELSQQVAAEIADLEAGRDPYARRMGDYWRTIRAGDKTIPLRVYAPQAATAAQPAPLVIALHGAGGDENMFFEGYGVGRIKKLADEQGALVVTPSTYAFSKPEAFDALIQALNHTYAIDAKRVYVLGHSMGGGATSRLAADRADQIAAACCLAGGGGRSKPTVMAPTLVIAAELDKIISPERLKTGAEKLKSEGLPVELRELENYGHTLMVGKSLPDAFAWLFKQSAQN